MSVPAVSVIIPAYNAEAFIKPTLQSVLAQSFQNFEVIVVNDGSTDQTAAIVNRLIVGDDRIQLIEQSHAGVTYARNLGIKISRGDLIAFLDADDLWHPNKLTLQTSHLDKHPEAGWVSCLSALIDQRSKIVGLPVGINLNGMVYRKVLEKNGIPNGSVVLVRRKCLLDVGLFDKIVEPCDDWDMWIRLAGRFPIVTVPRVLVGYRRTPNNASRNYNNLADKGKLVLVKAFHSEPSLSEKYYSFCLSKLYSLIAGLCIMDNEFREAWSYLRLSISTNPIANFTDLRRLGVIVLLLFATILPPKVYYKFFVRWLLPSIFGLKHGEDWPVSSPRHATFPPLCQYK